MAKVADLAAAILKGLSNSSDVKAADRMEQG
jgi:hypothetical protein